ncbi:TPA: hypothetical protein ACMWA4_001582 [Clostridioides difficile]
MSIIELNELTKAYRRFEKKAGFMGLYLIGNIQKKQLYCHLI